MVEDTIRTSMTKLIQDQTVPTALRELALEALHWRLRGREMQGPAEDRDDRSAAADRHNRSQ